jgi:hypothetical protein
VIPAMCRRIVVRVSYGKNTRPYLNKIKETRARDAVVECLPSKHESLRANHSTA